VTISIRIFEELNDAHYLDNSRKRKRTIEFLYTYLNEGFWRSKTLLFNIGSIRIQSEVLPGL